MLASLAIIFIFGMLLGELFKIIKLPGLVGMLLVGILVGPNMLNLIDETTLSISANLRQIALIIILIRAGLSLDIRELKKVGRPAILMCFVPACFEIIGMLFFAPRLLGVSMLEAAIMGSVVAAVSPAVIVPRMIKLLQNGYGKDKSIPQLIMAGASVDDVFVIVLFSSFTTLANEQSISPSSFAGIPISIVLGCVIGTFAGWLLSLAYEKIHIRDSLKVIILLSLGFLFVTLENGVNEIVPFSGLLAIMSVGVVLLRRSHELAERLSSKFSKLWVAAEILLFVLVGATVDIGYAVSAGANTIILLMLVLLLRIAGVFICLIRTDLNFKERIFCAVAYIPKATVQAAIGGIPLAMGLSCGDIVLTVSVLSIIITAPLGAMGVDLLYKNV